MENRFKSQLSKFVQSTINSCRPNNTSDVSDHRKNSRLIDLFSPKPQPPSSSSCKAKTRLGAPPFPTNSDHWRPQDKTSKNDRRKKLNCRRRRTFSSITDNYYYNWWSSEEEEGKSKTTRGSVSSDWFESVDRNREGDVDGLAVAKESSDPYEDFRVSMVDMIVEKEMFGVEELENLVERFVSLNSEEHHKVIFQVFAEIWETIVSS